MEMMGMCSHVSYFCSRAIQKPSRLAQVEDHSRLNRIIWIRPIKLNPSSLRGPHTSPIPCNYLQQTQSTPIKFLNPDENSSSTHTTRSSISTPHPIHPQSDYPRRKEVRHPLGTYRSMLVCTGYIYIANGYFSTQFRGC